MLKCYIWSTFLYGAETWTLNQDLKNKIEAFEMWCYRRMLKIKYTDHVSNDLVLAIARDQRKLLKVCHERKMRYFGHLVRAGGMLANICLGKIEGRRARGGQRMQWSKEIFKLAGVNSVGELVALARDREEWRIMVANPQNWGGHND